LQIQALPETRAKEITDGGLVEETNGSEKHIAADRVILAIPRRARQQLVNDLEFVCDELTSSAMRSNLARCKMRSGKDT